MGLPQDPAVVALLGGRSHHRSPLNWLGACSRGLFFSVAALAPLPYGSRDPATVSLWCILLGLALMTAPIGQLQPAQYRFSLGIIAVICCGGFILHEQLSSVPWRAPTHPVWDEAGLALGETLRPSAAIVRGEPFYALGPSLAALLALWAGLIHGVDRKIARRLLWIAAISGAIYACYGILSALLEPNVLLLREREAFAGHVTGPFVNRNTAAAYFGCCAAIWLLFALERSRSALPARFMRLPASQEIMALMHRFSVMWIWAGFMTCLLALFMTISRAGVILSLGVLAAGSTIYIGRDRSQRRNILIVLAAVAALFICSYVILGGSVEDRFNTQGFADGGRSTTYLSTLRLIADHPWFGSGLGTFNSAFPFYRSADASAWGIWNVAHSTPLELAADLGIPFAVLICIAWLIIFWALTRGAIIRRRDAVIPLIALCVALIAVLHSTIDFSLQVPGFAIVMMSIIGIGIAQAFSSQNHAARKTSV